MSKERDRIQIRTVDGSTPCLRSRRFRDWSNCIVIITKFMTRLLWQFVGNFNFCCQVCCRSFAGSGPCAVLLTLFLPTTLQTINGHEALLCRRCIRRHGVHADRSHFPDRSSCRPLHWHSPTHSRANSHGKTCEHELEKTICGLTISGASTVVKYSPSIL